MATFAALPFTLVLVVPAPAAAQDDCDWTPRRRQVLAAPVPPDRDAFHLQATRGCAPWEPRLVYPDGSTEPLATDAFVAPGSDSVHVVLRRGTVLSLEPDTAYTIAWEWITYDAWREEPIEVDLSFPARPYELVTGPARDPADALSLDELDIDRFELFPDRDVVELQGSWSDPSSLGALTVRVPWGRPSRPGETGGNDERTFFVFPTADDPALQFEFPTFFQGGGERCVDLVAEFESVQSSERRSERVCAGCGCATTPTAPSLGTFGLAGLVFAVGRRRARAPARTER